MGVVLILQRKPYGFSAALLSRLATADPALHGGHPLCGIGSLRVSKVVGTVIAVLRLECNRLISTFLGFFIFHYVAPP